MPEDMLLSKEQIDELLDSVKAGDMISCGDLPEGEIASSPSLHIVDFLRREILTEDEKASCEKKFSSAAAGVADYFGVDRSEVTLSFIDTLDFMTVMRSMPRKCLCAYMGTASGFSVFADLDPEADGIAAEKGGTANVLRSFL